MKRKFNIELNLTSPIQKITGFENIKKHVDIEISPLDDFFYRKRDTTYNC